MDLPGSISTPLVHVISHFSGVRHEENKEADKPLARQSTRQLRITRPRLCLSARFSPLIASLPVFPDRLEAAPCRPYRPLMSARIVGIRTFPNLSTLRSKDRSKDWLRCAANRGK